MVITYMIHVFHRTSVYHEYCVYLYHIYYNVSVYWVYSCFLNEVAGENPKGRKYWLNGGLGCTVLCLYCHGRPDAVSPSTYIHQDTPKILVLTDGRPNA